MTYKFRYPTRRRTNPLSLSLYVFDMDLFYDFKTAGKYYRLLCWRLIESTRSGIKLAAITHADTVVRSPSIRVLALNVDEVRLVTLSPFFLSDDSSVSVS